MKLREYLAPVAFVAAGCTIGWFLPDAVEHFNRNDKPVVQFTTQQLGDIMWDCRTAHGWPTFERNGTVVCTPGAGKPTSDDAYREADRQEALREQRDREIRIRERAEKVR